MKNVLTLNILTPEKELFNGEISELLSENEDGKFGILINHVAMITTLIPCVTVIKQADGKKLEIFTSTGVLKLSDNQLDLLCEAAEWPENIDLARAEESKKKSKMRLAKKGESNTDAKRAELALLRALSRIKIKK